MKYFVLLTILSLSAFAQNQVHSTPHVAVDQSQLVVINKEQTIQSNLNLVNQPEIVLIEDQQQQIPQDNHIQPLEQKAQQQKNPHHRKPHKTDHENRSYTDHNQIRQNQSFYNDQLKTETDSQWPQKNHENMNKKFHKKFWNKKSVGHIVFWIVLAVIAFFLIRKCVAKRNNRHRRRTHVPQQMTNPVLIDEEINKHYAEIMRLQQLKSSIEAQNRAQQQQPIIYHEQYPQQVNLNNSSGRMINENCYPRNFSQNIELQNIPVGVPVMIRNPYNHPEIYRQY